MSLNADLPDETSSATCELKDLQALLQKEIDDEVSVVDFKTTPLLPMGENYCSSMFKLDAVIKKTKDAPEEHLYLVAKMIPTMKFQKEHIKTSIIFGKEIFMYDKLGPAYKEIEKESIPENENLIDLFPKYYGGRLTRNEEKPEEADEDAVLLLENLNVRGYDTMDRKKGLDLEHAKLAISELARYHALGIAVKYHNPAVYEEAKKHMAEFPFDMKDMDNDTMAEQLIQLICQDSRMAEYEERIRASVVQVDWEKVIAGEVTEPWVTINHGDFWVNNIMFRHTDDGKIDDMKFIDFQISRIASPLTDLPYFFCASTSPEVLREHLDELLDAYYERFIDVLTKTGCDASPFTKESFNQELNKIAKTDYLRCIMVLKFFTLEVSDEGLDTNDLISSVMTSAGNKLYFDRAWDITSKYIEKQWL